MKIKKYGVCLLLCAWVMWAQKSSQGMRYMLLEAYPTFEGCIQSLSRIAKRAGKEYTAEDSWFAYADKGEILRFTCLPDTIKP